jgi:Tol biopolymer transport system component
MKKNILFLIFCGILAACTGSKSKSISPKSATYNPATDSLRFTGEVHLRNVKQLTFGDNNAEAYWSFDNQELVFQSDWKKINPQGCDQIFRMRADGMKLATGEQYQLISTGKGRTTCSYFLPDGRMVYASTHVANPACPEVKSFPGRYVWSIYSTFDIYITDRNGKNPQLLIGGDGYDAEATVSPNGRYIVFTSTRSGDLELWRYDIQTRELLQLTNTLGYDGGAFFSPDSKQIVWRASRPTGEAGETYKNLLRQDLVEPKELNIFVADADGKNAHQVTNLPGANWAPFFHPDGKRVLISSNHHSIARDKGRFFAIFMMNQDGTGEEQLTHSGLFDAFPMFSPDAKKIVFASNRNVNRTTTRDTNIFVADWIENPEPVDLNFKSWK